MHVSSTVFSSLRDARSLARRGLIALIVAGAACSGVACDAGTSSNPRGQDPGGNEGTGGDDGMMEEGTGGGSSGPPAPRPTPDGMHGYFSGYATDQLALQAYEAFKSNHVEDCGGGRYRVKRDQLSNDDTVSEGIGYGMLLAVGHDDRVTFDSLYNYFQYHANNNLMPWQISGCEGVQDQNNATDAELDVAMALVQAECRWGGGTYNTAALAVLGALRTLVNGSGNNVKPGATGFGDDCVNASYVSPGYYRVFARVDSAGSAVWNTLATQAYPVLNAVANDSTGLVPDWTNNCPISGPNYSYDAARTPWRVVMDYVWHGAPEAKTFVDRMTNWAAQRGITEIFDGFDLNGNAISNNRNSAFIGAFAVGAMAHSQERVDLFTRTWNGVRDNFYYQRTLKAVYLLLATGKFDPGSCYP